MRKIFCNVLEGVTYEDRCLFALSKVLEGNPDCEDCLVREIRRLKHCGIKETEARPVVDVKIARKKKAKTLRRRRKDAEKSNDTKVSNMTKVSNVTRVSLDPNLSDEVEETLHVSEVAGLIGKSRRRTQELLKAGKIPGQKVGSHWRVDKAEIEKWLLERKDAASETSTEAKQGEERAAILPDQEAAKTGGARGDPGGIIEGEEPGGAGECISG